MKEKMCMHTKPCMYKPSFTVFVVEKITKNKRVRKKKINVLVE